MLFNFPERFFAALRMTQKLRSTYIVHYSIKPSAYAGMNPAPSAAICLPYSLPAFTALGFLDDTTFAGIFSKLVIHY
jgi:hypothetical protein